MANMQSLAMASAVVLAGGATTAQAASEACGRYPVDQDTYTCVCTADQSRGGTVWGGSGPYTADSDLCQAARHAGAIGVNGGKILVSRSAGGLAQYSGSTQNGGVTTQSWGGSYDTSVEILRGKASAPANVAACGGAFDAAQSPMTCSCAPGAGGGTVWGGSGPFTADSDICTAALFEGGVIDAEGGTVTVLAVQGGLDSYFGQSHNGVTTQSWGGQYQQSFTFNWN